MASHFRQALGRGDSVQQARDERSKCVHSAISASSYLEAPGVPGAAPRPRPIPGSNPLDPSVGIRGPGGVFNCGPTPAAAAAAAEPIVGMRAAAACGGGPPRPGSSAAAMARIPFPPPLPPSALGSHASLKFLGFCTLLQRRKL